MRMPASGALVWQTPLARELLQRYFGDDAPARRRRRCSTGCAQQPRAGAQGQSSRSR